MWLNLLLVDISSEPYVSKLICLLISNIFKTIVSLFLVDLIDVDKGMNGYKLPDASLSLPHVGNMPH